MYYVLLLLILVRFIKISYIAIHGYPFKLHRIILERTCIFHKSLNFVSTFSVFMSIEVLEVGLRHQLSLESDYFLWTACELCGQSVVTSGHFLQNRFWRLSKPLQMFLRILFQFQFLCPSLLGNNLSRASNLVCWRYAALE